jgi:hypothetical protein
VSEPGHPHSITDPKIPDAGAALHDARDDFVSRSNREMSVRQFAVHEMQIRAADSARQHLQQDLMLSGGCFWHFFQREHGARGTQSHSHHGKAVSLDVVATSSTTRQLDRTPSLQSTPARSHPQRRER